MLRLKFVRMLPPPQKLPSESHAESFVGAIKVLYGQLAFPAATAGNVYLAVH